MMNTIYEFDYKDTHYDLKVNLKTRLALNDYQFKKSKANFPSELLEEMAKINLDKINEDITQALPLLKYADILNNAGIDPFEVFKIMLQTQYKVTEAQYNDIVEYLEEKEGSMKLCEIVGKISKDAFTMVEQMNQALNH